jgi:hypothetical protein
MLYWLAYNHDIIAVGAVAVGVVVFMVLIMNKLNQLVP